ncbi:type II secretion system minor pseudopilin GspK [Malonomonas rubra]|uniref:type II secretion system minor pseudopilin GspK n=1 Tax=Malonomonas rubra TaxID=57040 RepID=UPI0026EB5CD2|nr:type II secretion system minor pseudopilin GspK [Malonomonas rubra]
MAVNNERGMVLLLVLVVIALLSALLSEFAFSTLVDLRLTETFRDSTRAEYLARGGIKAGRMLLQTDKNSYDAKVPTEFWSVGVQNYPVAEGSLSVSIEDLDGRLPLNKLVDAAGNPNPVFRERFVRLCLELPLDNPEALADALIDWLDPDHEPEPEGAEDADYLRQNPPYEASDGPLQSLDELVLVQGFTPATVELLRPHVSSFGIGRLNINTATPEVLRSWDAEAVAGVDSLLNRRAEKPYQNLDDLRDTIGLENFTALNRQLDLGVTSSYYLINSQGRFNNGSRRLQAIVDKGKGKLLWQKVN